MWEKHEERYKKQLLELNYGLANIHLGYKTALKWVLGDE